VDKGGLKQAGQKVKDQPTPGEISVLRLAWENAAA